MNHEQKLRGAGALEQIAERVSELERSADHRFQYQEGKIWFLDWLV